MFNAACLQKELEETAKILPQQGSGIYTSQLLVMSVVDSVSLSNTDNHAASSVNEVQETDTPPGLSTSSDPLSLDTKNVSVNSKKSPKTCFQFKKKGVCHFGNNCRFQHDSTTLTKVANSAEVGNQNRTDKNRKNCFLFSKSGNCRFGEKCKFLHLVGPKDTNNDESLEVVTESVDQPSVDKPGEESRDPPKGIKKPRICRFFKQGSCKKGAACSFRHPERKHDDQKEEEVPLATKEPYNLIDFHLNVSFPFEYPVEMPCISLPEDQDSPTVIVSHMTLAAQEWLQAKYEMNKMSGRVELIFRPFLRWFDKNVEKLFTEGARKFKKEVDVEKAGFEFIANYKDDAKPREPAQPSLPKDAVIISKPKSQQTMEEKEADKDEELASAVSGMHVDSEEDEEEQRSSDEDTSSAAKVIFDPPDKDMRGTEVFFQGLKLSEAVGTLAVTRLTVIVQCVRCKERVDVTTPPRRNNLITCGRCNNRQIVTYRPCLVHPMSHVIGFLDFEGCLPFDVNMVTSGLMVGCLTCSHDNNLKGLQYGQGRNMWCDKCHQKMTIQADSCRFQRLQPAENIGSGPLYTVKSKGPKKQAKDPAIVDMLPLPENGSCKHYKKSFRWLRFPCCGKFYPCDECHDFDNDDGHEMKYATRMLCGFCAKEQPYSVDKPCVRCGSSTTKGRTQHWEGGSGCRNKIKMSKNDKQKYAGVSKTVSRKAQKAEPAKKGK
ncbi:hypothetical protein BSL78_00906 [Apostichopus japonicus]|uniref:Nucleoporin NUP42 n=1 Tax=Stichopus japonicus TaxID=307972 RepID=A0A2G8LPJ8_STIJA|nr:hypothetical protein BSL78_00906 [Apostichopus japonicus]